MTGSQDWCTPEWICDAVRSVFGRTPELDPFSNASSITGAAEQWFGPEHGGSDGFVEPWSAVAGTVFFNPPWRRSGDAIRKASKEWSSSAGNVEIIGLVPCSMNAKHWPAVEGAPSRCYLNKRPSFIENGVEKRGNPKDVAIAYWGVRPFRFADVFSAHGRIGFGGGVAM